ncbi:hypothetical protein H2204_004214 [Knufia peltigerae]|uniref:Major facilitator superfamily (MFS) profile domain-containing protein n=1 Tax=Knufia peltigerae TaxID=1002370 RepID=A0AA38Y812_9EURO|nr:hypothetical protein H2204_004214 [Knufia peltigerae]
MPLFTNRIGENVNGRLAFASIVMMLSQINFGMDMVAFTNTQAMNAFNKKFGHYDAHLKRYAIDPYFLSLLNSLTYVGQVFGVLTGGWIARHHGRRASFWVMSFWAIVSAILLVTAQNKEQVLVGRILNYIYLGQELVTVPVFQAEIAPPKIRGMVIGTFQLGTMSPRWLLVRNRTTEALESLTLYRRGKFTEDQIQDEFRDQVAMIAAITHDKGTFKEMWQGTNLKRSLVVIGANVSIQISGQGLFSKYGTIFLKDLNGPNPFQMFLINTSLQIVIVLLAMYMFDKVGRRLPLIIGSTVQTTTYFAIGGLGTISNPGDGTKIAMTALFTVYYQGFVFGWAPIYHILTSEIPSSRMRDVTYTVASSITVVTQFVVSFCIPYLLYAPYANLGAKIGFVFAPIAFLTLIFAIFGVPECRSFSLEEIDHLFRQRVAIRHFTRYKHGEILPQETQQIGAQKAGEGPSVELKEVADM